MDYAPSSRQAMTKPLSPAAQAVMDAYVNEDRAGRLAVAATLRAAADQADPRKHIEDIDYVHEMYTDGCHDTIATFLNIADELEAH
jgi:Mg-chelatase subunit ChlD